MPACVSLGGSGEETGREAALGAPRQGRQGRRWLGAPPHPGTWDPVSRSGPAAEGQKLLSGQGWKRCSDGRRMYGKGQNGVEREAWGGRVASLLPGPQL